MVAPLSARPVAERNAQPLDNSLELTVAACAAGEPETATTAIIAKVVMAALSSRGLVLDRNMGSLLLPTPVGSACEITDWAESGSGGPGHLRGVVVVDAHDS